MQCRMSRARHATAGWQLRVGIRAARLQGLSMPLARLLGCSIPGACLQAATEAPAELGSAESAAKAVALHAQKQHSRDDISIVTLLFGQT